MPRKKKSEIGPGELEQRTAVPASGRWSWVEGIDAAENSTVLRFGLAFAVLAVVIRLFFWAYTGRNWEDAFITVLHSENFVNGLGLTHYLGEGEPPLHGFTSPLSVLVPLVGDLIKVGFGLSFIKIVSALVAPLVVLCAMAIAIHPKIKLPAPLAIMVMGYLAFEHHQVLWGMAGMETQMTTFVLLASLYCAIAEKPLALGVALGFCMLARPDFAFWTVIAGLYALLYYPRRLPVIVGAACAVYLPWIVFTTLYYGSPVPNTMVAKALGYPLWTTWPTFDRTPGFILTQIWNRVSGSYVESVFQPLGPSFAGYGSSYRAVVNDYGLLCDFMLIMAVVGTVDILRKRQWVWLPAILFVLVYTIYYVFCVALVFGWYISPFIVPALLLAARGLEATTALLRAPRARVVALTMFAAAYLACFALVLPGTFATERKLQQGMENQVRKQAGLFLNRVMEKNETVGSESLGYLGYYSRRIVYDYPGLCSRKVVACNRSHPYKERHMLDMLKTLQPDLIALRYVEYSTSGVEAWIDQNYRIIASFEMLPYDRKDPLFTANWDHGFFVLAKKSWHPGAAEVNGESVAGINPKHARALNYAGKRLLNQGKSGPEVGDLFRKSIAANPDYAEAHNNLGLVLFRAGDAAGAMEQFKTAVTLDPDFAMAHNSLGVLYLGTGDLDSALSHLNDAARCDPASVDPLVNLADLYTRRGNLAEARRYYESALKLKPDNRTAADGIKKVDAALRR